MRRIAIINQKGGVGKTTTAANLGAALARAGKRVLVVDLDPQANLSMYLGVETTPEEPSSYGVLCSGTRVGMAVRETATPGLLLLPSHIDLSGAELELASTFGRETLMRDALDRWTREEASEGRGVDFLLFDCPPSLGLLSINGLCAASEVLVVAQTEFFALQGLSKLLGVIELVKQRLNPELELTGVLAALYDSRLRLAREVLGELRRYFPEQTFQTTIAANVRLAESPSHGKTIFDYAPESRGAQDYAALAEEVLAKGAPNGPQDEDLRDKADDLAHADATLRRRGRSAFETTEPALPSGAPRGAAEAAPAATPHGSEEPQRPERAERAHASQECVSPISGSPIAENPNPGNSIEAAANEANLTSAASPAPQEDAEAAHAVATALLQDTGTELAPDWAPAPEGDWLILHEPVAPCETLTDGPSARAVEADAPETPAEPQPEAPETTAAETSAGNSAAASAVGPAAASAVGPAAASAVGPAAASAVTPPLDAFGAGVLDEETETSEAPSSEAPEASEDTARTEEPGAAASCAAPSTTTGQAEVEHGESALAGAARGNTAPAEPARAEVEGADPDSEALPGADGGERRRLPGLGWGDYLGEERSRPIWPARRHA